MKTIATNLFTLIIVMTSTMPLQAQNKFFARLATYTSTLEVEFDDIDPGRKESLHNLADYIQDKAGKGGLVKLTVICTHNSRRSHMGQLWLAVAAEYYGIDKVYVYSGGTEATAFNPRAVRALKDAGIRIRQVNSGDNPPFQAWFGNDFEKQNLFSKRYDHKVNPDSEFAAVMVCSEADASCPFVPGAEARFAIPYKDPKYADDTAGEQIAYAKSCREIAREMFYTMKVVKDALILQKEQDGSR